MATALENTGPAEFVDPTTGFPKPPIGQELIPDTGYSLVAFTGQYPASDGSYAAGVGLFTLAYNTYHPYAVWTVILRPKSEGDRVWVCEAGTYCETLTEAMKAYERRGGKV